MSTCFCSGGTIVKLSDSQSLKGNRTSQYHTITASTTRVGGLRHPLLSSVKLLILIINRGFSYILVKKVYKSKMYPILVVLFISLIYLLQLSAGSYPKSDSEPETTNVRSLGSVTGIDQGNIKIKVKIKNRLRLYYQELNIPTTLLVHPMTYI